MLIIHAADEAIWHLVGHFHISEERVRLRIEYDRIASFKQEFQPQAIETKDYTVQHPYRVPDLIPQIPYTPPQDGPDPFEQGPEYHHSDLLLPPVPVTSETLPAALLQFVTPIVADFVETITPPTINWTPPTQGSVAAIIVQQNVLYDDDRFNAEAFKGVEVSLEEITEVLDGLVVEAGMLGVSLDVEMPANEAAFLEMAEAFRDAAAPETLPEGAEVHTFYGVDAQGMYLNGERVDSAPDFKELMPQYRKDVAKSDDEDDASEDGGHDVIVGANTLMNVSAISSAWIAAPVAVVGGNVYSYTVISQTNVWSDEDAVIGTGAAGAETATAGGSAGNPTQALNYSTYATYSNPMPEAGGEEGDQPQFWMTTTVEGSLVSVNWIEQYNIVSDNDVMSVTLDAQQTLLIMGDNGVINEVSLAELGFQYDLIVIDGHVINLNGVMQNNVMLDDDGIMINGPGGAMMNSGDNLLVNESTITQAGTTQYEQAEGGYSELLATAADGTVTLPDSVLNDPAFQGQEAVRVLHIKGDLVSVNMVNQSNVLADGDQVQVFMDSLDMEGAEVSVVTGSNTLVNSSNISEFGVDSAIHVAGDVYSDALLHQAELVSTDAPLMAGSMNDLASEAVLFLADGMLGEDDIDIEFTPIGADSEISVDAMETVLA